MTSNELSDLPLLDKEQLEDLREMIGDKFTAIVEGFKEEISQRLDLIDSGNLMTEDMAAEFHALASCAGNIGMTRFAKLSRNLMGLAEEGSSGAREQAQHLRKMYDESLMLLNGLKSQ